jgi:uncharacterized protein YndB with AHSA1/START domain
MESFAARAEMPIRASADKVFDAFVDPAILTKFWLARSSAPLAEGATVQWEFMVPGATETVAVKAFRAPEHLAFDWSDGIRVDLRIAKGKQDLAVVTFIATGFRDAASAVDATEGFSIVLCDLKTLLESGRSANLVKDKATLIANSR